LLTYPITKEEEEEEERRRRERCYDIKSNMKNKINQ
jgi:hypothetical protein